MEAKEMPSFEQQLKLIQATAVISDEKAQEMYPALVANEGSAIVRRLLSDPKNLRAFFGAISMAMQRTSVGVAELDKGRRTILFEAVVEELRFLGRFTEEELGAIYVSGIEDINEM